jgi:hypothetical protein
MRSGNPVEINTTSQILSSFLEYNQCSNLLLGLGKLEGNWKTGDWTNAEGRRHWIWNGLTRQTRGFYYNEKWRPQVLRRLSTSKCIESLGRILLQRIESVEKLLIHIISLKREKRFRRGVKRSKSCYWEIQTVSPSKSWKEIKIPSESK